MWVARVTQAPKQQLLEGDYKLVSACADRRRRVGRVVECLCVLVVSKRSFRVTSSHRRAPYQAAPRKPRYLCLWCCPLDFNVSDLFICPNKRTRDAHTTPQTHAGTSTHRARTKEATGGRPTNRQPHIDVGSSWLSAGIGRSFYCFDAERDAR